MERQVLDPREVELRRDEDFNAILNMIGEGAPVFSFDEKKKIFRAQHYDEKIAKELH